MIFALFLKYVLTGQKANFMSFKWTQVTPNVAKVKVRVKLSLCLTNHHNMKA